MGDLGTYGRLAHYTWIGRLTILSFSLGTTYHTARVSDTMGTNGIYQET
jgi:hypothetical protein